MDKFIENPYLIIKNLVLLIDELNNPEFRISILSSDLTEYEINKLNLFIFNVFHSSGDEEETPPLPKRILLQLVNLHIKDIIEVKLFTPKQNIIFYNCHTQGCYTSTKKRLQAAQTIQKYAIPRYNDPRRPEVKARLLKDFETVKSDFSFGPKRINKLQIDKDINYLKKIDLFKFVQV